MTVDKSVLTITCDEGVYQCSGVVKIITNDQVTSKLMTVSVHPDGRVEVEVTKEDRPVPKLTVVK